MNFDTEGHIKVMPQELLSRARENVERVANELLLYGTPAVFPTYVKYCEFIAALGEALGVHPRSIALRGSGLLGYSLAPKNTAWAPMRNGDVRGTRPSDIDVAIVDAAYFHWMDGEVQAWESTQGRPSPNVPGVANWVKRATARAFYCCNDKLLPPNTCVQHVDAIRRFQTIEYCGVRRPISAFVFKDWWCIRNRCIKDLRDLIEGIDSGLIPQPNVWA